MKREKQKNTECQSVILKTARPGMKMKLTQHKYIYRMLNMKWAKRKCLPNVDREC